MELKSLTFAALALGMGVAAQPALAAGGKTLEAVKARGELLCPGHDGSYLGFAELDEKGSWKGLDIDLCASVATLLRSDISVTVQWRQSRPSNSILPNLTKQSIGLPSVRW